MGGIRYIFLPHKDDVADADRSAKNFQATRIIHQADQDTMAELGWIVEWQDMIQATFSFHTMPQRPFE